VKICRVIRIKLNQLV